MFRCFTRLLASDHGVRPISRFSLALMMQAKKDFLQYLQATFFLLTNEVTSPSDLPTTNNLNQKNNTHLKHMFFPNQSLLFVSLPSA